MGIPSMPPFNRILSEWAKERHPEITNLSVGLEIENTHPTAIMNALGDVRDYFPWVARWTYKGYRFVHALELEAEDVTEYRGIWPLGGNHRWRRVVEDSNIMFEKLSKAITETNKRHDLMTAKAKEKRG